LPRSKAKHFVQLGVRGAPVLAHRAFHSAEAVGVDVTVYDRDVTLPAGDFRALKNNWSTCAVICKLLDGRLIGTRFVPATAFNLRSSQRDAAGVRGRALRPPH
jgi:hypothetical protein